MPAGKDVSQPPPKVEATPASAGPEHIEKAPAGESKPTPPPEPLPPEPALPTKAVSTPGLQGDAQPSEADAAKAQAAIRNLPITDPALSIRAGEPPKLELAGDADPGQAQAQKATLDQGISEAAGQGKSDAAQSLGENEIYPTVPKETLKAQIGEGGGGGGAGLRLVEEKDRQLRRLAGRELVQVQDLTGCFYHSSGEKRRRDSSCCGQSQRRHDCQAAGSSLQGD